MKRRHFLRLIAAAGTGPLVFGPASFAYAHTASNFAGVALSRKALGATVAITAYHADRSQAMAAISAAFDEIELVEQSMSLYRPDSQLSRLNHDGVVDHPPPYFLAALRLRSPRTSLASTLTEATSLTMQATFSVECSSRWRRRVVLPVGVFSWWGWIFLS